MDLHELAAKDRHEELREALSQSKDNVDSYKLSKEFHKVINRHGLKGTPLHFAIIHNSTNCVKALLDHGADVNKCVIQCERGEQEIPKADALFLAKETGNSGIIKMIEKKIPASGHKHGGKLKKTLLLCGIFFSVVLIASIIVAVSMSKLMNHEDGSYETAVKQELLSLKASQENHYSYFNEYSTDVDEIRYITVLKGVTVEVTGVDEECFEARGKYVNSDEYLYVDCEGLKEQ